MFLSYIINKIVMYTKKRFVIWKILPIVFNTCLSLPFRTFFFEQIVLFMIEFYKQALSPPPAEWK
jgi:hypothetical protein